MGQNKYLYVTNEIENARWFANENGCDTILKLENVPIESVGVDPEDGIGKNVQDELERSDKTGLPAYLIITKKLDKKYFKKT